MNLFTSSRFWIVSFHFGWITEGLMLVGLGCLEFDQQPLSRIGPKTIIVELMYKILRQVIEIGTYTDISHTANHEWTSVLTISTRC